MKLTGWMRGPHDEFDVLAMLGEGPDGVCYYLYPLNLRWSSAGPDQDLERFAEVGACLARRPEIWAELLRTSSWRETLVGCVCAMLLRPPGRCDDLVFRFERGSFVSPQVCMTMGIVYPEITTGFLREFLDRTEFSPRPWKQIASAHAVLERLGTPPARELSLEGLDPLEREDAAIGLGVVGHQWDFWARRSGAT